MVSSILPQNERKKFDLTTVHDTSGRIVFVRFSEELRTPKRHFEINWPLRFSAILCELNMYIIFYFMLCHFTFARFKWDFGSPLTFQGVKISVCCWTKAGSIKWSRKLWGKWYSSKPKLVAWLNKRSLKLGSSSQGKLNVAYS